MTSLVILMSWLSLMKRYGKTGTEVEITSISFHELQFSSSNISQIGLVEQEWLATLATINADEVTFTDYVDKGRELATSLKNEVN